MLINWKRDGLISMSLIDTKSTTGTLVGKEKIVWFTPGWNEIPDEQWDVLVPHVKEYIARGDMELFVKKETKNADGTISYDGVPLRDVPAKDARDIVKNTFNLDQLKVWEEDMKLTTEIRNLIVKQITLCEAGGPEGQR